MNNIGQRLVDLRKQYQLTQQQVAERIWVNKASISAYELGTRQPSYEVLIKLARLYGVSTDYLLGVAEQHRTVPVDGLSDKQISLILQLADEMRGK